MNDDTRNAVKFLSGRGMAAEDIIEFLESHPVGASSNSVNEKPKAAKAAPAPKKSRKAIESCGKASARECVLEKGCVSRKSCT